MKNYTDITIVLDRSGSMESIKNDVIGGFNEALKKHRDSGIDIICSLVQFDDRYENVFTRKAIKDAPNLDNNTYQPRGSTALHDAIGTTIDALGNYYYGLSEDQRPSKVIVMVITDGLENASTKYSRSKLAEMIARQRDEYSWEFVFIGSNQDAIMTGQSMSIMDTHSINLCHTGQAVCDVIRGGFDNAVGYAAGTKTSMSWTSDQIKLQTQHFKDQQKKHPH